MQLEAIAGLVMLTDIKASLFFFISHPQTDDPIDDFQDDYCHYEGKDPGSSYGDKLNPELTGIAEED